MEILFRGATSQGMKCLGFVRFRVAEFSSEAWKPGFDMLKYLGLVHHSAGVRPIKAIR